MASTGPLDRAVATAKRQELPARLRLSTEGQGGAYMKKVWTKPQFVKIKVGMEINTYESAKL
jgi:coenzyme PQQ precursor peptide PqqA